MVFVVCFLPSNVAQVLIWVRIGSQRTCESVEVINMVFYPTLTLTFLNSILDPVLYYFSSPALQRVCRQLVRLQSTEGTVDTGEDGTKDSSSQADRQTGVRGLRLLLLQVETDTFHSCCHVVLTVLKLL